MLLPSEHVQCGLQWVCAMASCPRAHRHMQGSKVLQEMGGGECFLLQTQCAQMGSFLHLSETGGRSSLEFKIPHVLFSLVACDVLSLAYLKLSTTVRQGSLCAIEIYLVELGSCTEDGFLSAKKQSFVELCFVA